MLNADLKRLDTEYKPELYRLRWASICAALGNGLTGVILTIIIAQSLGAFATSAALTALSIGLLFSFASGGIHADSANRIRAIVRSDLLRFMANIIILVGVVCPVIVGTALVIIGCLVNGLCAGYFRPAQASLWSVMVPAEHLKSSLATNSLYNRVFLAVGGGLGGVLIAVNLGVWGLILDAGTFLLTALIVRRSKDPRQTGQQKLADDGITVPKNSLRVALGKLNVVRQWVSLLQVSRRSSWLPLWVSANIVNSFVSGIAQVCLPVVLVQTYTNEEIGVFQSVGVVALLAGAVVTRVIINVPAPGIFQSWVEVGNCVASILVAFAAPAWIATSSRFSGYFCSSLSAPSFGTFIADQFDEADRGKVYAMQTGVSSVLAPFGMLAASLLLLIIPVTDLLLCSSLVGLFLGLIPLVRRGAWKFALTPAA